MEQVQPADILKYSPVFYINEDGFLSDENSKKNYVALSRARFRLYLFFLMLLEKSRKKQM
jgi:hypothetical protein